MADVNSLLSQYVRSGTEMLDVKKAKLGTAAATRKAILLNQGYAQGAAADTRIGEAPVTAEYLADPGTPEEIIAQAAGRSNYINDATGVRSTVETGLDYFGSVANGAIQAVGGIGGLTVGAINDDAGAAVASGFQAVNRLIQEAQTDALNARRRAYQARNKITETDNRSKNDGTFLGNLKQVGRDVIDSISNLDDATALDTIATGAGSLVVAGPMSKGLQALGVAQKAAMPLAIGLMEGGGVHQQMASEIMEMPIETLMAQAPGFAERAEEIGPEAARREYANQAGLTAAAIQGPIGAATGKLVARFERAPFSPGSTSAAVSNLLKETLEESIQGGTGRLSQNIAARGFVDPERSLSEGVGAEIGLGAVGGLGAAGIVQAPRLSLQAAVKAAKLPGQALSKLGEAIGARADRFVDDVEAESPVSAEKLDAAAQAAIVEAPIIRQEMEQAIAEADLTPEEVAQNFDYLDRVFDNVAVDKSQAETAAPVVAEAINASSNKFELADRLGRIIADDGSEPAAKADAAFALLDLAETPLFNRDLQDAIVKIDDDHPALAKLRAFEDVVGVLQTHPRIQQALQIVQSLRAQTELQGEVTPEIARETAALAKYAPEKLDLATAEKVRFHLTGDGDGNGRIEDIDAIDAALALLNSDKVAKTKAKRLGLKNPEIVSKQIQTEDRNRRALSLAGHVKAITSAVRQGNTEAAKTRLKTLMLFAQHMQNKVAALNEHLKTGDGTIETGVHYNALSVDDRTFKKSDAPLWINPQVPNSIETAQMIALDAEAVVDTVNRLTAQYKDLGVPPLVPIRLDESLNGKSREIAVKFRRQARGEQVDAVASEADRSDDRAAASDSVVEPESQATPEQAAKLSDKELNDQINKLITDDGRVKPEDRPTLERRGRDDSRGSETVPNQEAEIEPVIENAAEADSEIDVEIEAAVAAVEDQTSTATPVVDQMEGETAPQAVNATAKLYPGLIENLGAKVKNWLWRGFKPKLVNGQPSSRLAELTIEPGQHLTQGPIKRVYDALGSIEAFKAFTGKLPTRQLTDTVVSGYSRYLAKSDDIAVTMRTRLEAFLAKPIVKGGLTFGQALIDGTSHGRPVNQYVRAKMLSLVEQLPDGTLAYDEKLLQSAVLAGLQWLLDTRQNGHVKDEEEIAKILGIDESEVTSDMVYAFNNGTSVPLAKQALAAKIQEYWGLKLDPTVDQGLSLGLLEGMAAEVLTGLEAAELLRVNKDIMVDGESYPFLHTIDLVTISRIESELKQPGSDRQMLTADLKAAQKQYALLKSLNAFPTAIDQAVLVEAEEQTYIGEAPDPKTIAKFQLRNRLVKNTKQQLDMIANEEAVGHRLNMPMVALVQALDAEGTLSLFGEGDLDDREGLNAEHRNSMEGRNRAVLGAFEKLQSLIDEMSNKALTDNSRIEQLKVYFRYNVTRVGRLQMLGRVTPQGNKLMRSLLTPTHQTVDLTKPEMRDLFLLAMAQHWGVKVHKQPRAVSVAKAEELANGQFKPAIDMLRIWLKDGQDGPLNAEQIQILRTSFNGSKKGPLSVEAVQHAIEYARYLNASETERASFETPAYIEADGVTDGPINALMHLATGRFSPKWLRNMAKGGMYVGGTIQTLSQYQSSQDEGASNDLYQETTDALKLRLKAVRDKLRAKIEDVEKLPNGHRKTMLLKQQQAALTQMEALDRLLATFLSNDVRFDGEGNLVIKRGVTKNPLTITIYGSGKRGIASKITAAILDSLYEKLEDASGPYAKDSPFDSETQAALRSLTTHKLVLSEGKTKPENAGYYFVIDQKLSTNRSSGVNYKLSTDERSVLTDNLLTMFVEPMVTAINDTVGEINPGKEAILKAVQFQSIVLEMLFKSEINKAMAARKAANPDWERSDFLSQDELNAILQKLMRYSPLVQTGTQTFFMSGTEKADLTDTDGKKSDIQFGRGLTDNFSSSAYVYGASRVGVLGVPTLVIGPGDGQMIQFFSTAPGRPPSLLVFDGINMSILDIEDGSRLVNEAVYKAWLQKNPMQSLATSWTGFAEALRAGLTSGEIELTPDQQAELMSNLSGDPESNPNLLLKEVTEFGRNLDEMALENQARKNVLARVTMAVDHMASAESPYVKSGTLVLSGSMEEMAEQLNVAFEEELRRLKGTRQTKPKAVSKAVSAKTGVRELTFPQIRAMMSGTVIPTEQRSLLHAAYKALKGNTTVLTGSQEEILRMLGSGPVYDQLNSIKGEVGGFYDPASRTVYLVDPRPEVVLHELIHAATLAKVTLYVSDSGKLTDIEREAIDRIKHLMWQWLASTNSPIATQIRGLADQGDMAGALNEFMAWVLSNPELAAEAKTVKVSPLVRLAKAIWTEIKTLLGAPGQPGANLYSNLKFNTMILIKGEQPSLQAQLNTTIRYQTSGFGNDPRLTEIRQKFADRVAVYARSQPTQVLKKIASQKVARATAMAERATKAFVHNGFNMTPQEQTTFAMVVKAFATEMAFNPNTLSRLQDIYDYVTGQLTPDMFQGNTYLQAHKLNAVLGQSTKELDEQGRTTLLPGFVALAVVNPEFRSILAGLPVPKTLRNTDGTFDAMLENAGNEMMDRLGKLFSGEGRDAPDIRAAIDQLTNALAEDIDSEKTFIDQMTNAGGTFSDRSNAKIVELMNTASDKAISYLDGLQPTNKVSQGLIEIGKAVASIVNEEKADQASVGLLSILDTTNSMKSFREIVGEIIGRTSENAAVFDMIKLVRAHVDRVRQQFRDVMPSKIIKKFKTAPTAEQLRHMFEGLAKTDLMALLGRFSQDKILGLLSDFDRVRDEIQIAEDEIRRMSPHGAKILVKARELARFMNTGEVQSGIQHRNAHAVANLSGMGIKNHVASNSLAKEVDMLVTLYALDGLEPATKDSLSSLVQNERDGVAFIMASLIGRRKDEDTKLDEPRAVENHYKGFIPSLARPGTTIIVAEDREYARLRSLGYERIGDYKASPAEAGASKRGYYFAPLAAKAIYNQGIMQNVRPMVYGVDPVTGLTLGSLTAGAITDPVEVKRIKDLLARNGTTGQPLLPVFRDSQIVAFERSVDPKMLVRQENSTDIAKMLGVWAGRQFEEMKAAEINNELISELGRMWKEDRGTRSREYVNLLDPASYGDDPVITDAVNLINRQTHRQIRRTFGEDEFWVRRSMLNDVVGYRSASIGDMWTGNSRLSPGTREQTQRMITGILGIDAYKKLMTAEKFYENFVSDASRTIVIRSVIVPAANFISNVYQLISRGVPIKAILKGLPKKALEVNAYVKRQLEQIDLEVELDAAKAAGKLHDERRIQAQLDAIHDANSRMSIWPLIQAGEFSSITDAGVRQEDTLLSEGKMSEYIEKLVAKLPPAVRSAGRYGYITTDTTLYQGLMKAVTYGDFLAKAVLYEDLVDRQNKGPKEALARITEEFVHFDRLAGRMRAKLQSLGLIWFWHFKLRSLKVALSTLRNNPLHALIGALLPSPPLVGSVGTPLTDNILAVGIDGRLENSMGPGQGFRAHMLHPVAQVFG